MLFSNIFLSFYSITICLSNYLSLQEKNMCFKQDDELLKEASRQAKELQNALNAQFSALDAMSLNNPVLSPIIAKAKEAMIKGDFLEAKSYIDKIYEIISK